MIFTVFYIDGAMIESSYDYSNNYSTVYFGREVIHSESHDLDKVKAQFEKNISNSTKNLPLDLGREVIAIIPGDHKDMYFKDKVTLYTSG